VPPQVLAVVMVLQRLEGLSDREAADRFAFDVRWRYAAGVADAVAGEETASFAHTVLVGLRARLRRSADQDRIFRVTCQLARQAGLVGVRRVLDSAPLGARSPPRTPSRCCAGTAPDRVISTVDPEARHGQKTAAYGFDGYKAHSGRPRQRGRHRRRGQRPARSGRAACATG
jgi:hypothetical protein